MAYFEQTRVTDAAGNVINPAKEVQLVGNSYPDDILAQVVRTAPGSIDDQLVLLRRLIKILESQQATDPAQRQRIAVDSITAPLVAGGNTIGSVIIAAGANTVGNVGTVATVTNMATLAGWDQRMFADPARTAYNTGIRSQLVFS